MEKECPYNFKGFCFYPKKTSPNLLASACSDECSLIATEENEEEEA